VAEQQSDSELVARALGGDHPAFGELVARYRDAVVGVVFHRTGSFEDARDIAQEAFVKAYANLPKLRKRDSFASWLYHIADFTALQAARRSRHEVQMPTNDMPSGPAVHSSVEGADLAQQVREALATLDEPTRLAVILHYVNGYSHAEVAGFLGTTPGAIRTRVSRARSRLREEMTRTMGDTLRDNAKQLDFNQTFMAGVVAAMRAFGPPTAPQMQGGKPDWTEMWVEKMQTRLKASRTDLCSWHLVIGQGSLWGSLSFLSEAAENVNELVRIAPVLDALAAPERIRLLARLVLNPMGIPELASAPLGTKPELEADLARLEEARLVTRKSSGVYEASELGRMATLCILLEFGSVEYAARA